MTSKWSECGVPTNRQQTPRRATPPARVLLLNSALVEFNQCGGRGRQYNATTIACAPARTSFYASITDSLPPPRHRAGFARSRRSDSSQLSGCLVLVQDALLFGMSFMPYTTTTDNNTQDEVNQVQSLLSYCGATTHFIIFCNFFTGTGSNFSLSRTVQFFSMKHKS